MKEYKMNTIPHHKEAMLILKRYAITSLAIILTAIILLPHQNHAANGEKYDVGNALLNVRSAPSIDGEIIGQLQAGDQLIAFDEQYGWVQTYYGGTEAWVAKHHLIATNQNNTDTTTSYSKKNDSPSRVHTYDSNHSLHGYNIILDPGHGGYDPGSTGISGTQEKLLALETAKQVAEQLRAAGANVLLTRSTDSYLSLSERIRISDAYLTHAFISIHYNAFPNSSAHGINTFYHSNQDQKLAENVHQGLASSVSLRNRGIVPKDYYVLRNNTAPSILLELGFITNYSDFINIRSNNFQNQVANGITNGLKNYFSN